MDGPQHRLIAASHELARGRSVVRAVIVKTWGSTPREVGADMLIASDGSLHGTIGGGCGEAEVYDLAQDLLTRTASAPSAILYHVDLTENPEEGGEKVCGGRFDVLVHRLDASTHHDITSSARAILEGGGQLSWLTDIGSCSPGFWREGKVMVEVSGQVQLLDEGPDEAVWLPAEAAEQGRSQCFSEPMGGSRRLVVVGAGHIARPLSRLAAEVGYQVVVLDDRPEYARAELFPEAWRVVAGDYVEELPALAAGPGTSVVLVTRGHKHDQDCLRLTAEMGLDYLGMIGSRRRIDAVYAELVEEGVSLEALRRVHAPIGLEIGARTPAEIAVSILAQMIGLRRLGQSGSRDTHARKRRQRTLD